MSEEKTQVFRGDDAPEMAIAETAKFALKKRPDAPVDQRGMHDQQDGASFDRALHDAAGGPQEQRHMDDADGLSELRQLHGKDARDGAAALHDAEGMSELRQLHDDGHAPDGAAMRNGDGPSEQRSMEDADGLSDQRSLHDADGPSDQRRMEDAEGLSDLRALRDSQVPVPQVGAGDAAPDSSESTEIGAAAAADAKEAATAAEVMSDPDLTFKVEDEATPWALAIHLEERIASLGLSTTKVKHQLDKLDESIERLAKRIAR